MLCLSLLLGLEPRFLHLTSWGEVSLIPTPSPAEITQRELIICGASGGQLASLLASVWQEGCWAAALGLSRVAGMVEGTAGSQQAPGLQRHVLYSSSLKHALSASALALHSPLVKGPHVPILQDKDTRHKGSLTQKVSHRPRSEPRWSTSLLLATDRGATILLWVFGQMSQPL